MVRGKYTYRIKKSWWWNCPLLACCKPPADGFYVQPPRFVRLRLILTKRCPCCTTGTLLREILWSTDSQGGRWYPVPQRGDLGTIAQKRLQTAQAVFLDCSSEVEVSPGGNPVFKSEISLIISVFIGRNSLFQLMVCEWRVGAAARRQHSSVQKAQASLSVSIPQTVLLVHELTTVVAFI